VAENFTFLLQSAVSIAFKKKNLNFASTKTDNQL